MLKGISIVGLVFVALATSGSGTSNAQQPKLEMHRVGVNADDG